MIKISIVLPTYNERQNLPLTIDKIEKSLNEYQNQFEIIVVDDNSPDKTYELGRSIGREKSWVHVIRRIHERGLSSAIVAGFAGGKGDYLIVMDADMQHDESILPKMIKTFDEGFDIVIGSRKTDGGGVADWPLRRKLISWIGAVMTKIALPMSVKDPMSGYFGLTKNTFEKLVPGINPRGFKILIEFIARAHELRVKEIGYIFRDRQFGKSKLSTNVMIGFLVSLYELTAGKFISLQFVQYSLVGLAGVAVNQFGLWFGMKGLNLASKYSLIVGIELSIFTNFILNNYWTFRSQALRGMDKLIAGLIKFNLICLAGAVINYSTALFLDTKLGINIFVGNLVGIAISTIWNYIINVKITWETE